MIKVRGVRLERTNGTAVMRYVILVPMHPDLRERLLKASNQEEVYFPFAERRPWIVKYQMTEAEQCKFCESWLTWNNNHDRNFFFLFQTKEIRTKAGQWTQHSSRRLSRQPLRASLQEGTSCWPPWVIMSRTTWKSDFAVHGRSLETNELSLNYESNLFRQEEMEKVLNERKIALKDEFSLVSSQCSVLFRGKTIENDIVNSKADEFCQLQSTIKENELNKQLFCLSSRYYFYKSLKYCDNSLVYEVTRPNLKSNPQNCGKKHGYLKRLINRLKKYERVFHQRRWFWNKRVAIAFLYGDGRQTGIDGD